MKEDCRHGEVFLVTASPTSDAVATAKRMYGIFLVKDFFLTRKHLDMKVSTWRTTSRDHRPAFIDIFNYTYITILLMLACYARRSCLFDHELRSICMAECEMTIDVNHAYTQAGWPCLACCTHFVNTTVGASLIMLSQPSRRVSTAFAWTFESLSASLLRWSWRKDLSLSFSF